MELSNLLAARLTMALSLGFHIIFAAISMILPFFMAFAYRHYLKTKDEDYLKLTKLWLRGTAILFAVGAVSGTVLSFELGLLWPTFMLHAGPIFGMPFSLEGAAFFIEAIAISIFIYGWGKIPERVHLGFGFLVGISGLLSGILVIAANGWMNTPTGFTFLNGVYSDINPLKAMLNPAWFHQSLHMLIASFMATGFSVAGVHAWLYLKSKHALHLKALKIAVIPACIAAMLMPLSGDISAKRVAQFQPLKLAAFESHFDTQKGASLVIGGLPNMAEQRVDYAIELPYLLSFLATGDFKGEVKGLNEFDPELWPSVTLTHICFQIMVGIGMLLLLLSIIILFQLKRYKTLSPSLLKSLVFSIPLGFIAIESGWMVTELGRQPWIIYGIMKTEDAVTSVPGQAVVFYCILLIYSLLSITVFWLMKRQFKALDI